MSVINWVKSIPASIKWIIAGALLLLLSYVITMSIQFEFAVLVNYMTFGLTVLAIILSGTAVSGDRMRANISSRAGRTLDTLKYSKFVLLFAVPFYIMFVVLEFI
ncbi:DUF5316 family protein [Marinilactibacillus sp. Marseille-P9653]|uniref:DUF5316 family protein n=1 Tax=Marinilactibacillus sp. Marseille-P9653 TaxID=2866583 RepID=UPI001CE46355|nr:DUF5316 family protein [Marinilactibacillus sp. Marseille-P9653]